MNITGSLALLSSNARYKIQKENLFLKGVSFVEEDEIPNLFDSLKSVENANIAYINNVATQIIFNGLLVDLKIKKEYNKELYSLVEDVLSLDEGVLQEKVLRHICASFISAFKELDVAIIEESKEMRFILKILKPNFKIILRKNIGMFLNNIPVLLQGKRVMIVSRRSDLFKVQFVRLKTDARYKERFDFNLFAIDPLPVIENADQSLYFESLDALKMTLLTYEFDVCIIDKSIYDLPLLLFLNDLNKSTFILGEEVYSLFNIVETQEEANKDDSSLTISLDTFDKEITKNSTEAKFTSGTRKKRGK